MRTTEHTAYRRQPRQTMADRFWAKVDRGGPDDCWEWTGQRGAKGHGRFTRHPWESATTSNRIALEFALGRLLTPAECALHSCDHPPCCNPAHLFVGSIADNNADAARKGRMHERLNADDVRELRSLSALGWTTAQLVARYAIAPGNVRAIVRGAKRRHVEAVA